MSIEAGNVIVVDDVQWMVLDADKKVELYECDRDYVGGKILQEYLDAGWSCPVNWSYVFRDVIEGLKEDGLHWKRAKMFERLLEEEDWQELHERLGPDGIDMEAAIAQQFDYDWDEDEISVDWSDWGCNVTGDHSPVLLRLLDMKGGKETTCLLFERDNEVLFPSGWLDDVETSQYFSVYVDRKWEEQRSAISEVL